MFCKIIPPLWCARDQHRPKHFFSGAVTTSDTRHQLRNKILSITLSGNTAHPKPYDPDTDPDEIVNAAPLPHLRPTSCGKSENTSYGFSWRLRASCHLWFRGEPKSTSGKRRYSPKVVYLIGGFVVGLERDLPAGFSASSRVPTGVRFPAASARPLACGRSADAA
jgi:hypothetical protein